MDLVSIFLALWRHRIAVVVVVLLTVVGGAFVLVAQPPQYESSATVLLVPPPRPTDDEAAGVNSDNPLIRSYDPGIVINIVAAAVNSEDGRAALVRAGADEGFEVAQTVRYGFSSPVAEILSTAETPEKSKATAELVIAAFQAHLRSIQSADQVDERYFISTRIVDPPDPGEEFTSGKLRVGLGVAGLGMLALFTVITTSDAIARVRDERHFGLDAPPNERPEPSPRREPPALLPAPPPPAPNPLTAAPVPEPPTARRPRISLPHLALPVGEPTTTMAAAPTKSGEPAEHPLVDAPATGVPAEPTRPPASPRPLAAGRATVDPPAFPRRPVERPANPRQSVGRLDTAARPAAAHTPVDARPKPSGPEEPAAAPFPTVERPSMPRPAPGKARPELPTDGPVDLGHRYQERAHAESLIGERPSGEPAGSTRNGPNDRARPHPSVLGGVPNARAAGDPDGTDDD